MLQVSCLVRRAQSQLVCTNVTEVVSIPNEAPIVPYASRLLDEHCAALVNEGDV
jgi:hypothetical protein